MQTFKEWMTGVCVVVALCSPAAAVASEADTVQVAAAAAATTGLPQSWSYSACVEYARANNIDLHQSRLTRESSGYDLEAARGQWLPTFNFSTSHSLSNYPSPAGGNFTYNESNGTLNSVNKNTYNGSYGITGGWTVFNGNQRRNNIKRSELQNDINDAYSIGGAAYMLEVVEEFSGVDITAYAEVDFEKFTAIVDTIGGVEVTLPVAISDEHAAVDLPAGTQTLNGAQALGLCRARHAYDEYGGGDFYRAANQRMVIGAIIKKILTLDPVSMVNAVSSLAESVTVYPLTVTDIVSLAMQFQNFDVDTGFYSGQTPTNSEYTNNIWYEIPDEAGWEEMMERVEAGLPPYSDESQDFTHGVAGSIGVTSGDGDGEGSEEEPAEEEATYSGGVLVLNGTLVSGLASRTATELEGAGFSPYADSDTSTDRTTTMVYYNGSARSSALGVAKTLGIDEANVTENTVGYTADFDVVLVLGSDYQE